MTPEPFFEYLLVRSNIEYPVKSAGVVKVVSTGHHPERFPCIKNSQKEVLKDSLKWKIVEKYSKLFNLGDTVEFYCVKKRNCNN